MERCYVKCKLYLQDAVKEIAKEEEMAIGDTAAFAVAAKEGLFSVVILIEKDKIQMNQIDLSESYVVTHNTIYSEYGPIVSYEDCVSRDVFESGILNNNNKNFEASLLLDYRKRTKRGVVETKKLNTFWGKEIELKNSVFLGGTCGISTWREELISNLQFEENGVILVDPRVEDYVYERDSVLEEIAKEECKLIIFGITNTANTASIYSFVEASWLAAKGKNIIVYCNLEEFEDGPVKKSIKNSLGFFASKGIKIVKTINELAKEVINYEKI